MKPQINKMITAPTDEAGALIRAIPAYRLAQVSGYKSAHYAENCCEDESGRFVLARRDELRDHTCNEPDDDRPEDVHGNFPLRVSPAVLGEDDRRHRTLTSRARMTLSSRLGLTEAIVID